MTKIHDVSGAYSSVSIIGSGAWGTALAVTAAKNAQTVTVWGRKTDVVASIDSGRANPRYLPGVALPAPISATTNIEKAAAADAILVAVPAQSTRAALSILKIFVGSAKPVVLCSKGMEKTSGLLMTEVLRDVIPVALPAVLSGPSFATDVARGMPTAVTIAGQREIVVRLQTTLGSETFRPYRSDDVIGVALGGAAKNVYAIASGICEGLGLGESARAALLARSFAELVRFGEALGGSRETLMGLSGLGDLVLTATSSTSRNYALGLALGRGASLPGLTARGRPLAEGVDTAPALVKRARASGVELPIAETVASILDGSLESGSALERLMSRPLTSE